MSSKVSGVRRGAILIGLALTLVVPLVPLLPGGKDLMRIPGFDSLIGREPFWWALFAVVLLYVLAVERRPLASIGLHKPNWKTFAIGAGASGAIAVFSGVVVYYGLPLLHLHENADALKKLMAVPYWFRFAIVLRAAVVEETLFRGYGIERLRELTGSRFVAGALTLAEVGVGVLVGVGVGAATGFSYEPMSQIAEPLLSPSSGRVTPFCDMLFTGAAAQTALLPASIAALPVLSGKYAGLPVSAPRLGLAVVIVAPHEFAVEPPNCRLFPPSVIVPLQFPPDVLLATMVFFSDTVPAARKMPPPAPALLLEKVLLVTLSAPPL